MKLIVIILFVFFILTNDSTKIKPIFKYKKQTDKSIDSLEYKTKALQQKIDSINKKKIHKK